jgi:hypothetical protein
MSQNDAAGERQTTWQRRVASFQDALRAGWRSYRLAPWLFERAGHSEQVTTAVQAFGSTELFPSEWFSEERRFSIDGMGREWGEQIAREETRAFLTQLGEGCPIEPAREPLASQVDRALEWVGGRMNSVAVFAPARWLVLQSLQLEPVTELAWLPGAGAKALHRGTFSGVPVFSEQRAGATDLWVVDFDRIGTWQYAGGFDDLATTAQLLRDQFVRLDGAPVMATRITADEFFAVTIEDVAAARGIRIPLESSFS